MTRSVFLEDPNYLFESSALRKMEPLSACFSGGREPLSCKTPILKVQEVDFSFGWSQLTNTSDYPYQVDVS